MWKTGQSVDGGSIVSYFGRLCNILSSTSSQRILSDQSWLSDKSQESALLCCLGNEAQHFFASQICCISQQVVLNSWYSSLLERMQAFIRYTVLCCWLTNELFIADLIWDIRSDTMVFIYITVTDKFAVFLSNKVGHCIIYSWLDLLPSGLEERSVPFWHVLSKYFPTSVLFFATISPSAGLLEKRQFSVWRLGFVLLHVACPTAR